MTTKEMIERKEICKKRCQWDLVELYNIFIERESATC